MSYVAPVKDLMFNLQHLAGLEQVARLPGLKTLGWRRRRRCWKNARA